MRPAANGLVGALLGLLVFVVYNANGREIPNYDSQPTKLAAVELATSGTLKLDRVVTAEPLYAERHGFGRARAGSWRSRYPVAPAVLAAGTAWSLGRLGLLDLRGAGAPAIAAKLTASALVAASAALAFLAARGVVGRGLAVLVATGYSLGTGLWPTVSQTLWQHETAVFGLAGAMALLARGGRALGLRDALLASACLGMALSARLQVAPAAAVLAAAVVLRAGGIRRAWVLAPMAVAVGVVALVNLSWFGHVLGGAAMLEQMHAQIHWVSGSIGQKPWLAALGLLVSPSRGLLVFSPIVAISAVGAVLALQTRQRTPLLGLAAALAQFVAYACYSVWWGGHTYGPRYVLDLLPLLVPAAAIGVQAAMAWRLSRLAMAVALAWSVALAAAGAFVYPAERWNTEPAEVDRNHERLWDWHDPQVLRCWKRGLSPQNFALFDRDAWQQPSRRSLAK